MKLKLILLYVFVILISFGLTSFFLDKNLEENSLSNIQSSLISEAYLIENQISVESLKRGDVFSLDALVKVLSPKIRSRITIIDKEGKVLADSERSPKDTLKMENHSSRPEISSVLSGGKIGIDTRFSHTLGIDMLYIALPIKDNNQPLGVLRLALPLGDVQKTLSTIRKIVFLGLLLALGFAFVLGYIVTTRITKPINRIIQASRRFSEGDFTHRIISHSKDEIGELSFTLNKMAQDLEDKIREIRQQNQELSAIFNSMIEGIIVVDKTSRIVSVNPAIEKIFGILNAEAQSKTFLEAIRNNEISEIINNVLTQGKSLSVEVTLVLPGHRIFEVNAVPIFENDSVNGCLVVIHDITEIRRLETIRRDFVANVSHELKTPLTSIKGFVETLLEGALDDKENNRNFLKIIRNHAERLNSLVNDLLSLSYLESKNISFEINDVKLSRVADEVILGFGSQLRKKRIEIVNGLAPDILVKADEERIKQVFTNLIDNALKFNREKGAIKIYSEELDGKIRVIVEDSGIGIPEKDIPRIFERFYRVDKARSRELGGTGLGLSIVKHIVELHGGMVGVESSEGSGSRFFFTLLK
ncbi:MAG: ATP-binding protein [Candidatus Omnitrophica bacterium]|nr:ATP-binding protein [Candidatus Omnitrophota bacterium]